MSTPPPLFVVWSSLKMEYPRSEGKMSVDEMSGVNHDYVPKAMPGFSIWSNCEIWPFYVSH